MGFGFEMGFGLEFEMGFMDECWPTVGCLGLEFEMGLVVECWPTVGCLGLKELEGFGLEGWISEESTSVTLDQLISHVPRGPRTNLR